MNEILQRKEIRDIISNVLTHNWNTDYAIRYVTVEISKLVERDLAFFNLTPDEKIARLKDINYQSTYPLVVCKSLHELIRDVLDYLGIKSKVVIATNTKVPLYALIVDGEHGRYFIDALYDLFRSQHRIQPVTYGSFIQSNNTTITDTSLISLPLDYIKEMDLDLGLIHKEYFSDYINQIKPDFLERNRAKKYFGEDNPAKLIPLKIDYIKDHLLNIYPVNGPMERVGLYVYYRVQLFNKGERNNFFVFNADDGSVYIKIHYAGHDYLYEEEKLDNKYSLTKKITSL